MQSPAFQSFAGLLRHAAETHGDTVFLPRRHSRGGDPVSYRELHEDTRRIAAGLRSLGLERGDRVGLVAENRYEWVLCDQACAYVGAVDVPRGTDTAIAELLFILGHSACRLALVESERVARELASRRSELPHLEHLILMCGRAESDDMLDLDALRERGDRFLEEHPGQLDAEADAIQADDLLTIIYTSGTTANPKGVMLTHGNVLENIRMVSDVLEFSAQDVALSVLPAWHAYERIMDYVLLFAGGQLVYSDRRHLKDDLRAVRPTIFVAVPRIWELLHDGMVTACRKERGARRRLLEHMLEACRDVGARRAGFLCKLTHGLYRRLLLPKFIAATGGRLRLAVSGGGALPAHVDERLLGMGIPLLNGYGLTETSPVVSVRLPRDNRPGTIGPPLPRTEVQIRDDAGSRLEDGGVGLIWIRGAQVMRGYYENADETARVLTDGWFNTGDLGCIEPDGHLRITGRAKDTIVLAGGENVEPERIETALKTSAYVEQAVVVGQDQKHLGVLIVPHVECLEKDVPRSDWDPRGGVLEGEAVQRLMRAEIDRLISRTNGFRALERLATFRVVEHPMTIENGMLTQTLKVKRHVVHDQLAPLITSMFAAHGARAEAG